MGKLTVEEREGLFAVEDALHTVPLEPLPRGFTQSVMKRVRAVEPLPRFHLTWLDISISLFALLMVSLLLWIRRSIPPQVVGLWHTRMLLFYQQLRLSHAGVWLAWGGVILFILLLVVLLFIANQRPRRIVNK